MIWRARMSVIALFGLASARAPWAQSWRRRMSYRDLLDAAIERDIDRSYDGF